MKVLIITAHPHPSRSHTYQTADKVEQTVTAKGHEVKRHEAFGQPLVQLQFDEAGHPIGNDSYDALIADYKWADEVVYVAPMWNLGFPWALKNLIDGIIQAKKTFVFTPNGKAQGLLTNIKRTTVYWSAGGPKWIYRFFMRNYLTTFLRDIMKFLGAKKFRHFGIGSIRGLEPTAEFSAYVKAIENHW